MTNTNYPSATPPPPPPKNNRAGKTILIAVLAAALLGTWGYLLWDKNNSDKTINDQQTQIAKVTDDKEELQKSFDMSLARLDSVTGANNNLQGKLTDSQKDIEAKKAEIRKILNDSKATKADLARAKNMIADLNDKISSLEAEVTRLTGENQELTANNTVLKQEKADVEQNLQSTTTQKEELEKTVDVASTFSASNIQIAAVNEKKGGKEKATTTAKRVDKLVVSFDVENRIAKSGPADMYIIVTGPDGKVISDASLGSGSITTRADGEKSFTTRVPVEYVQGSRKNVSFPIRQNDFQTGDYKIEVYHNGFKIGEGVRSLKKGGLFG
jgi:peptidoglycan hydrolase CwlO-like protein